MVPAWLFCWLVVVWDDWGMAKRYGVVDRDQGFLFPPDMREWLPGDHPVWLVISVVEDHLDTRAFHARRRTGGAGRGRRGSTRTCCWRCWYGRMRIGSPRRGGSRSCAGRMWRSW